MGTSQSDLRSVRHRDRSDNLIKKIVKMSEGEEKGLKTFSLEEVAEHIIAKGEDKSIWTVVHDRVYDVTKFLDEHPGGEEIMIENAGIDSTEAFEDVGHSSDAREMLKEYLIGNFKRLTRKVLWIRDQNHGHQLPPEMKTEGVGPNIFCLLELLYWQRWGGEQFLAAIDEATKTTK